MSRRILLGLTAGVAVGVLFGERAAVLEWPATADRHHRPEGRGSAPRSGERRR
jgi:hypothetical protein